MPSISLASYLQWQQKKTGITFGSPSFRSKVYPRYGPVASKKLNWKTGHSVACTELPLLQLPTFLSPLGKHLLFSVRGRYYTRKKDYPASHQDSVDGRHPAPPFRNPGMKRSPNVNTGKRSAFNSMVSFRPGISGYRVSIHSSTGRFMLTPYLAQTTSPITHFPSGLDPNFLFTTEMATKPKNYPTSTRVRFINWLVAQDLPMDRRGPQTARIWPQTPVPGVSNGGVGSIKSPRSLWGMKIWGQPSPDRLMNLWGRHYLGQVL